jgi:hypothetical protein
VVTGETIVVLDEGDDLPQTNAIGELLAIENVTVVAIVHDEIESNLHHKHLPQLKDARLIEYDERSEKLLVRNLPELAELNLDHCAAADIPS